MKEDMSHSNLGTVALHASKVPTNVFSSTLNDRLDTLVLSGTPTVTKPILFTK